LRLSRVAAERTSKCKSVFTGTIALNHLYKANL
jgi:hypothetical protein